MLSSSIPNSGLKNPMSSNLNYLFEAPLFVDYIVVVFWDVELAFMIVIITLIIWVISCFFFSSLDKFSPSLESAILGVGLDYFNANEKEKTDSRNWDRDLILINQSVYIEWVMRNLMRCKKLVWSTLSLDLPISKLQFGGKSIDAF